MFSIIDAIAMAWIDWRYAKQSRKFADEHPEYGLEFTEAKIDKDGLYLSGSSPAIVFLAEEAAKMLGRADAQNYLEISLLPHLSTELRPIRLTVQYDDGKSPARVNSDLFKAIVMLYRKHPADVAEVCDDFLDRSGALLGKVRKWAADE